MSGHRLAVGLLSSLLVGCAGGPSARVSPDEVLRELDAGSEVVVVDVRSRSEYEAGHVPGARHLSFLAAWSRHSELGIDKDRPIVVYCEHGPRAALARFGLESLGYRDVRMLDGHMSRWREDGRPLERGEAP